MILDSEQVRKVALLARLDLTPAEEEQFSTQLSSILEYFEQLSELDTENIAPTTRAIEVSNITRKDELEIYTNRDEMLSEAPDQDGDFFRVPQILASPD